MSATVNLVRKGFFMDSVALMRISRTVAGLDGVEEAALMMGTPANKGILADAGLLAADGEAATGGDLIVAVRAGDGASADSALAEAESILQRPGMGPSSAGEWRPRSLRTAVNALAGANLALISVPGDFAAAEARKALRHGLHAMIFSDNVSLEDEIALKTMGKAKGLLVMGPDCGTAIIGGVPVAFANAVPRGDIGLIGASGTGVQEVSSLIARMGGGVSHAIGVGGRDLREAVGGLTTLMALDALDADPATRHVVLISKPPAAVVAERIARRIGESDKTFTVCFVGGAAVELPKNARLVATLKAAATDALGTPAPDEDSESRVSARPFAAGRRRIKGLFCGGTLAAEAQTVLIAANEAVASNVPIPGATALSGGGPSHGPSDGHVLIDLGADEYTRGRPHPMIDPAVRDDVLRDALGDPQLGAILLALVIGYGAHDDPAGELARTVAAHRGEAPLLIASVTGTDGDPQGRGAQIAALEAAGVLVAPSNADAAELAVACLRAGG